jgi:transposase
MGPPSGRVEKWRGRFRSKFVFSVCPLFRLWVPQYLNHAPFPLPAHRTGRADFPHPALTQNFMPSRSTGRDSFQSVYRDQVSRRDTWLDIGDTLCLPACA